MRVQDGSTTRPAGSTGMVHPTREGAPVSQATRTTTLTTTRAPGRIGVVAGVVGALLALAVAYSHVADQGGFPGDKSPAYIGIGYYVLEVVAVVVALALLVVRSRN